MGMRGANSPAERVEERTQHRNVVVGDVTGDLVAAARTRVRGRPRQGQPETVDVTELPLDKLVGMTPGAHPYGRVLARSTGRRQTIRAIESNTRVVTRVLRGAGACGVPKTEASWDDPYRFPWHRFTEEDAETLMAALTEGTRNANTFAARVDRVRAILRQCHRQHLIDRKRLEACLAVLKAPEKDSTSAGRALEDTEVERLFDACAGDADRWRGTRDAAILAVLLTTGMRGCELCDLDLVHYDRASRELEILPKGRRSTRRTWLTEGAAVYLDAWLERRGGEPGPLVVRGRSEDARLTVDALDTVLRRLAAKAGIAHFSSHDCRRTVATRLLRLFDISVVMKVLGHKHPTTTARYDRATQEHLRGAIEQISLPERPGAQGTESEGSHG